MMSAIEPFLHSPCRNSPLGALAVSCCQRMHACAAAGHPIAYKLVPANTQLLLGLPGSTTAQRAAFATKSLWVMLLSKFAPSLRQSMD